MQSLPATCHCVLIANMPPKDAAAAAAVDAAPALAPAVPPGHFAVNVPLPQIFLPELIIRRDSEAVAGSMDALVLSTSKRDDGSFVVKMSVAKRLAISLYQKEHGDDKVPEAKAVGALIVRHIAGLIITRLKSSLEIARAAVESESPDGESLPPPPPAPSCILVVRPLSTCACTLHQLSL
jgi:hypothetical protein